jgi:hypothetical protein
MCKCNKVGLCSKYSMKVETSTEKFTYFPLASIVATPTPFVIDLITLPFRGIYHLASKYRKK